MIRRAGVDTKRQPLRPIGCLNYIHYITIALNLFRMLDILNKCPELLKEKQNLSTGERLFGDELGKALINFYRFLL